MKKTTVARVLATAASTAGALVCPQLVANPYADTAIKAGVATLLSCIPDMTNAAWQKSKEYEVNMEIKNTPKESLEIPAASVEVHEIKASTTEGVSVEKHKEPAHTTPAKDTPKKQS